MKTIALLCFLAVALPNAFSQDECAKNKVSINSLDTLLKKTSDIFFEYVQRDNELAIHETVNNLYVTSEMAQCVIDGNHLLPLEAAERMLVAFREILLGMRVTPYFDNFFEGKCELVYNLIGPDPTTEINALIAERVPDLCEEFQLDGSSEDY